MNFRNRYAVVTVRLLFGIFMIFSGVSGLLMQPDTSTLTPQMISALTSLKDSGLFYMIKITEALIGLMLIFNFLPALAAIFLAPISIGIIVFNSFVEPSLVISGVIVALVNIYLGYIYWNKYEPLFTR